MRHLSIKLLKKQQIWKASNKIYVTEFGRKATRGKKASIRPTCIPSQKSQVIQGNTTYFSVSWKVFADCKTSQNCSQPCSTFAVPWQLLFPTFLPFLSSLRYGSFVTAYSAPPPYVVRLWRLTVPLLHTYKHLQLLHGIPAFMKV